MRIGYVISVHFMNRVVLNNGGHVPGSAGRG